MVQPQIDMFCRVLWLLVLMFEVFIATPSRLDVSLGSGWSEDYQNTDREFSTSGKLYCLLKKVGGLVAYTDRSTWANLWRQ